MTVMILDNPRLPRLPYPDWVPGPIVVTTRPPDETAAWEAAGATVRRLSAPHDSASTVWRICRTGVATGASAVIAPAWPDLYRAAVIAEHLGIPGPGRSVARGLRDLVLLRERWATAGVATIRTRAAGKPYDLYLFAGRSSRDGVYRLRRRWLRSWPVVCAARGRTGLRDAVRHLTGTGQERPHGLLIEDVVPGATRTARYAAGQPLPGGDRGTVAATARAAGVPPGWPFELTTLLPPDGRTLASELTVGVPDDADHAAYGAWVRAQLNGAGQ